MLWTLDGRCFDVLCRFGMHSLVNIFVQFKNVFIVDILFSNIARNWFDQNQIVRVSFNLTSVNPVDPIFYSFSWVLALKLILYQDSMNRQPIITDLVWFPIHWGKYCHKIVPRDKNTLKFQPQWKTTLNGHSIGILLLGFTGLKIPIKSLIQGCKLRKDASPDKTARVISFSSEKSNSWCLSIEDLPLIYQNIIIGVGYNSSKSENF